MTGEKVPGGYRVRLRFGRDGAGKAQRDRFLIVTDDDGVAADREARMRKVADALAKLRHPEARNHLIDMGRAAHNERAFRALERAAEQLLAERSSAPPPAAGEPEMLTFRQVAELWCSGKLTERFPDSSLLPPKADKGRADDRAIVSTFYPALGDKPVAAITLDDIDRARRLIPKDAHPNTRRRYVVKLRSVLRIAAGPLRLMPSVPEIDIPRRVESNLFGYLYPQEEALLLACQAIPLVYRVLYGYLSRNGCRIGETVQLTWDHVDLETGDLHVDKRWTKTRRARRWVLEADVLEALELYYEEQGRPGKKTHVFPGRRGNHVHADTVRGRWNADLRQAGITRQSLLEGGDGIEPLRVHDLRASFVTLSLRAGRSHKWIMTRTGHETLGVLRVYDRLVQDAEEHHLPAWFSHMAQAIPELRDARKGGPRVGQPPRFAEKTALSARSGWTPEAEQAGAESPLNPHPGTPEAGVPAASGPAAPPAVGQVGQAGPADPGATDSPVEQALAYALRAATDQGRWDVVLEVTRELSERRRARVAPAVPSLSDARAKRNGDKS